jgi:transposase
MPTTGTGAPNLTALEAVLGAHLTADQAAFMFKQGQEAMVFALLALAKQVAEKTACPDGSLKTTEALLTVKFNLPVGLEKGSGTFCRNGPKGASHKRFLTPFPIPRHCRPPHMRIERREDHRICTFSR